jgi:hypothetical protein
MKKIINQAPIVRYRASVSEIFFPDYWNESFSAESTSRQFSISKFEIRLSKSLLDSKKLTAEALSTLEATRPFGL